MSFDMKHFIKQVVFKEPQVSGNMTIFPLFHQPDREQATLGYLLLEEALQSGAFEVGEFTESGEVNSIVVDNHTGQPVLILDGEELLGAKQNRMVNATMLIPQDQKVKVPVSCVERARWRYSSRKFDRAGSFGYSSLRGMKAEQVTSSLEEGLEHCADQGAIWEAIACKQARRGTQAPTEALHETYDQYDERLQKMIDHFRLMDGQSGLAFFINHRFICLDFFDRPATLDSLWTRLLKSYAMEALDQDSRSQEQQKADISLLWEAIAGSECQIYQSVGLGQDLRLRGAGIVGAGLVLEERMIHLSVFRSEPENRETRRIHRPARRRGSL